MAYTITSDLMWTSDAGLAMNTASPRQLAIYFRQEQKEQDPETLSSSLLAAIERESIPPTVYAQFLTAIDSLSPLASALRQQFSRNVRRAAILQFGKSLRTEKWEEAWSVLGGTRDISSMLGQLSVMEVKELSRAIGRCSGGFKLNLHERQQRVTELVESLLANEDQSGSQGTFPRRPLYHHYAQMVPACTPGHVKDLLRQQAHVLLEDLPKKRLVQHHFLAIRELIFEIIASTNSLPSGIVDRTLDDFLGPMLDSSLQDPTAEAGFTSSMSFAAAVLEILAALEKPHFPNTLFVPKLVMPLMRRLKSHKVKHSRVARLTGYAIKYLRENPELAKNLSWDRGSLIFYVARYWSIDKKLFGDQLVHLIILQQDSFRVVQGGFQSYRLILDAVEKSSRYELLRLLCLHNGNVKGDIDTERGLAIIPWKLWPIHIFLDIPRRQSLLLLQRLMRAKPEGEFLKTQTGLTILSQPMTPTSRNFGDPKLLLALIQQENQDIFRETQSHIEALKGKANRSREQTDRAFFAKSTIFYAIASGSLDLYSSIVLWMRRFLKDPLTVKVIYAPDTCNTVEGVTLLGGIPRELTGVMAAEIRDNISKANSILLSHIRSAVMALREPFFYAPDWSGPLTLLHEVVAQRVHQASRVQHCLQLSEDQLYETLWAETLTLLLEAEKIGIAVEHRALGFNSPHGPLDGCELFPNLRYHSSTGGLGPGVPSTIRFLDNHARARDEMWRNSRRTVDPVVVALLPPFPQGLPIQCLMRLPEVTVDSAPIKIPFTAFRAAQVLAINPSVALADVPSDEETRNAIGQFIDNFEMALVIDVMQYSAGKQRLDRASTLFSHTVKNLPRNGMDEHETDQFWRQIFERTLPWIQLPPPSKIPFTEYPVIPSDVDPQQRCEWDPTVLVPPKVERRQLKGKVLDCLLSAPMRLDAGRTNDFRFTDPAIQAYEPDPIWSHDRLMNRSKISSKVREGLVLSALLLEASKINGASKILASPFPSKNHIRYPSLFLDERFLLTHEKLQPLPWEVLSSFITMVPSTLLKELAVSALDVLSGLPSDAKNLASVEYTYCRLQRLLSQSDRPYLASELVLRTVMDRPDASSWHWQLFTKGFIRCLAANQAESLIAAFVSSICAKLEYQATRPQPRTDVEGPTQNPAVYVKITTVKLLVQMLDGADFIPANVAFSSLRRILKSSSHIDIRVLVIDSLLNKLSSKSKALSDALIERILSTLEATIPIAGSLNERRPMSESGWTEAEQSSDVPEVYDDGWIQALPPILSLILDACTSDCLPSETMRRAILERVLLPTLEKSRTENIRWVKIFLSKHSNPSDFISLPYFPVKPDILKSVIQSLYSEVPERILGLYQQYVLINISTPTAVIELNKKLFTDMDLRNSNEAQHWLSHYGRGLEVSPSILPNLLKQPWQPTLLSGGIQVTQIQDLLIDQAMALLGLDDMSFSAWDTFIDQLRIPAHYLDRDYIDAWSINIKPILRRIIDKIESIRTLEWQKSQDRKPTMLPPTSKLHLWLLSYPHLDRSESIDSLAKCIVFAKELADELRKVKSLGLAHHGLLTEIEVAALRCSPFDGITVGCYLGDLGSSDAANKEQAALQVELANTLLRRLKPSEIKYQYRANFESIVKIVDRWKACEFEEIRMRGMRLHQALGL